MLGWAEVERSVVRVAEAASLELVNVVAAAAAFVLLLFLKVVGIGVVDVEKAIARLEMGETVVEEVEVEVESLASIETL
jgi:hypothetical protein